MRIPRLETGLRWRWGIRSPAPDYSARYSRLPRDWCLLAVVLAAALAAAGTILLACSAAGSPRSLHDAGFISMIAHSAIFQKIAGFAFPLLALIMAFSFAQASASSRGEADYALWLAYRDLAARGREVLSDERFRSVSELLSDADRRALMADRSQQVLEATLRRIAGLANPREKNGDLAETARKAVGAEFGFRTLRATLAKGDDDDYKLRLQFVPEQGSSRHEQVGSVKAPLGDEALGVTAATAVEAQAPSAGRDERTGTALTLRLLSDDMAIEKPDRHLTLPPSGASSAVVVPMKPIGKLPSLKIIITRQGSAQILQEYSVKFEESA